jgi:hypothetical protein
MEKFSKLKKNLVDYASISEAAVMLFTLAFLRPHKRVVKHATYVEHPVNVVVSTDG